MNYDPSKYTDVMLDLETLGTRPGSAIISIGAVAFTEDLPETDWALYESLPIAWKSCEVIGLTKDQDTLDWWNRQAPDAKRVFNYAVFGDVTVTTSIITALNEFNAFYPTNARLWSNGANFDVVLLREAMYRAGIKPPWMYWNDRCFRTIKNGWPDVEAPAFQGVKHGALFDALHQTRHLVEILRRARRMQSRAQQSLFVGSPVSQ